MDLSSIPLFLEELFQMFRFPVTGVEGWIPVLLANGFLLSLLSLPGYFSPSLLLGPFLLLAAGLHPRSIPALLLAYNMLHLPWLLLRRSFQIEGTGRLLLLLLLAGLPGIIPGVLISLFFLAGDRALTLPVALILFYTGWRRTEDFFLPGDDLTTLVPLKETLPGLRLEPENPRPAPLRWNQMEFISGNRKFALHTSRIALAVFFQSFLMGWTGICLCFLVFQSLEKKYEIPVSISFFPVILQSILMSSIGLGLYAVFAPGYLDRSILPDIPVALFFALGSIPVFLLFRSASRWAGDTVVSILTGSGLLVLSFHLLVRILHP